MEEYEFKEEFQNQVKAYVKADDKAKELQKQLKELNQEKKVAEDAIMKHLERLGETNINITGGKLIVNKYGAKGSFKEDIVKEVLKEKIKDPKTVESIFDKIQEIRAENAKIQMGLKRTGGKKK
jgi:single-stranded DNA-specific DHH superfamily exonuclease